MPLLHTENQFFLGIPLNNIAQQIKVRQEFAQRLKHEILYINAVTYGSAVAAIQGKNGESMEEGVELLERAQLENMAKKDNTSYATYLFYRMLLRYMVDDYKMALSIAKAIKPIEEAINGFMVSAEYNFFYSLAITAAYKELPKKERKYYRSVLKRNQRKMKKWASCCRENFEHKYLLVAAEIARLENRREEAMSLYEKAIALAGENNFVNDQALANELAGKFYLDLGLKKIAVLYMKEAYLNYNRWQAFAKARYIKKGYWDLFKYIDRDNDKYEIYRKDRELSVLSLSKAVEITGSIDKLLFEKFQEKISTETNIDNIFKIFVDTASKIVGVDKGYLIIEKNGELFIETAIINGSETYSKNVISLEECSDISKGVVRYVARTLEAVVLDCRNEPGIFATDPHIAEANPGSIACLPLLLQRIPFGVLYLENSYIPGAFNPNQLEILKLLSAEIVYAQKLKSYLEVDSCPTSEIKEDSLTERELEVLRLMADDLSNKEIAKKLFISVNTVKTHIKNIYEKLQVNRRIQAVQKAKENNLL